MAPGFVLAPQVFWGPLTLERERRTLFLLFGLSASQMLRFLSSLATAAALTCLPDAVPESQRKNVTIQGALRGT